MKKVPIQQVSQTTSIPSPTGGLDTRSPLSNMDISKAVQMTNAVPTAIGVAVRKGYQLFRGDLLGVESMFSYVGAKVVPDRLFVAGGGEIIDVSDWATPIAPKVITNTKVRTVQMSTQGGQFLVVANGTDAPCFFNGTVWTDFTISASPAALGEWTYTGTLANLINPIVHQKRLWFVVKNSTRIAYGPINSLGGAITTFDVSGLLPRGGIIKEIVSWSADGGSGLANRLVIVSSEGDVVIFSGADPSVATDFRNDGVWQLAAPAPRAFIPYDGDVLYFCERGIFPLSNYLQSTSNAPPITMNVSNTIGELVRMFTDSHGFDYQSVPNENLLVINLPQLSLSGSVQLVFNSETNGWALFTGLPANCWANLNGTVYFAGGTSVWKAFTGWKDGALADGSGGRPYTAITQQAFSTLGAGGVNKHVSLMRVNLISSSTNSSLKMSVKTDFDTTPPANTPSVAGTALALWDTSQWDQAVWGNNNVSFARWQGAAASGTYVSVVLSIQATTETVWTSTDLVFEVGGILS